ncbi:hypothetical protein BH09BAC3_BH09BAC3_38090 [soil metagenome]
MAVSKKSKTQPPVTVQNFPIVGIGASAGGLDAFKRLLAAIPENSGMAYVLVQHLDPSHESILPEILQRVTKIPVHKITEDIHLAPDHIYITPSNKILTSTDGVLQLTPREKKNVNLSIDIFFASLADVHKEFAVGVVLSGTGSDGTLGLKAIKEHGGISIVQDSGSAAYDSMPQSAVHAGVVDFILSPEKIPAQLLRISSAYKTSHFFKEEEEIPKGDGDIYKQILLLLRHRSGVDFLYYKQPTFHRRIARRIAIVKKKNLSDYLKFLRTDKAEQDALFQDVLIPVTSFFRDPKTFQALTDTVFPTLIKNKSPYNPIRVWIAGCSTGEEAFSMAMCLHEFLGDDLNSPSSGRGSIQIFASDISEKAIKKARAAIYTKAEVEGLSASRLRKYFTKSNGGYEVNKLIRDICVFAPHNFLKDPPFAKMDLISCRNVLIYMDTFLQKKAFATFHYALKENGFLLLGKSETPGASIDLFSQVGKHEKIYSRKPAPGRFIHVATDPADHPPAARTGSGTEEELTTKDLRTHKSRKTVTKHEVVYTDFRKSAEAIMLSKSPASVVVNEAMDIVHIHGSINPFLEAPPGKPTHNIIKMAREGLAFELRNAIHKATKEQASVTKQNIPVKAKGKQSLVTIEVIPLTDTIELHYLIRFEEKIVLSEAKELKASKGKISEISRKLSRRNQQLEEELSHTREDMRSITEVMEASNEELQSANEELQSSNEEMQSLNEELETSKEELQSTNEELVIVNQELLDKQEQLNISRFYSEAIVTTMREPLVVLDKALRVKTANAAFYKKFNVDEKETEDKLFYELQNHQFDDTSLRSLLERILPQKDRIEDFEITLRLPEKGDRIILINARQIVNERKSEQLILLAMEDITDRVTSERILKENDVRSKNERQLLHDFFTQAPAILAILKGPEHVFEFANPAFIELSGGRTLIGKKLLEAVPEVKGQGFFELLNEVSKSGKTFTGKEMPMMVDKGNGKLEKLFLNFTYQAFKNDKGEKEGILVFAYDVTELVEGRKTVEANALLIHNIYMNAPASICTFKGPEHIYELVNPAYQKLFDKRDLVGKPFLEALPEVRGQGVDKILDHVYHTGEIFTRTEIPIMLARADNMAPEQRYFNTTMQPIYNEENDIIGVVNFGYDVTEQITARKKIEASEKRFSNILSQSLMAIGIFKGENMVIAFVNEPLLKIWGKGPEIVGKPLFEVMPELASQQFPKDLHEVYVTGIPFSSNENRAIMTRDGIPEERFFSVVYQPYTDVDNTITGVTVLGTEVTEYVKARRKIEESAEEQNNLARQLKLATDSAKVGIWSLDIASSKLEWSDIHKKLWGYEVHLNDLTYEDWHNVIVSEDRDSVFQKVEESKVNHKVYDVDYRIKRASDGAIVWIKSTGHYQYDEFGVAHTLTGVSMDITEQKSFTEELEKKVNQRTASLQILNEELNQTNGKLDQYAYVASHDLQEPLRKIIFFSGRLLETHQEGFSTEVKDHINKIVVASMRMRTLIQDLLNYSRLLQHEKLFVQTDLNVTLKDILSDLELLVDEKKAQIESGELPSLEAIPLQMNQLFYNLVSNALKFSKQGVPPVISITSHTLSEMELLKYPNLNPHIPYIEIIFRDNGIGFEQEYSKQIFTIFQRLHSKEAFGGTGIGLALAKRIVENHYGEIFANAKEDEGASFHVILPLKQQDK